MNLDHQLFTVNASKCQQKHGKENFLFSTSYSYNVLFYNGNKIYNEILTESTLLLCLIDYKC